MLLLGNKFLDSNLKWYLIAATAIISIFCIIPFELYYTGREYWNWNYKIPIMFALTGLFAYMLIIALLGVLFKVRPKLAANLSIALFWLGLVVLITDIFAPLQTSLLDGRDLYSDEPIKFTVLEAVLFLTILFVAFKSNRRFHAVFASYGTVVLLVISVIYLGLILISGKPSSFRQDNSPENKDLPGNVYHVVLDEMQTDAAILFLNENNNHSHFPGFTLFENNTSNYLYTSASFPSYMTGTLFQKGKFTEWQGKYRKQGLLRHVFEKGYNIIFYSPRRDWCNNFITECRSLDDIYINCSGITFSHYKDFVQIWFTRLFPNFLTNEALAKGKKLAHYLADNFLRIPDAKIPLSISEGKEPFSSVLMLRELTSTEKSRAGRGQYIYAHAILPHGPYVMDKKGAFNPEMKKNGTMGYFEHVECAFNLLVGFLNELKKNKRYDSSTIIIHADTGHGHRGFISKDGHRFIGSIETPEGRLQEPVLNNNLGWKKDQLLSRTMSLLMIKPPFQNEELQFSTKKTQMIDLYPTIIDLLQLEPPPWKIDGISAFDEDFPDSRQTKFYLFPPGSKNPEMIQINISNPENLPYSDMVIAGSIIKFDPISFPSGGISFDIGERDPGRLKLTGFSGSETIHHHDSTLTWRWAIGTHGKMTISNVHLKEDRNLKVRFTVMPFVININEKMILKTSLSQVEIILKQGWNEYTVPLKFPSGENLDIEIFYKKAASPKSLGVNQDKRNLSVSWDKINLTG